MFFLYKGIQSIYRQKSEDRKEGQATHLDRYDVLFLAKNMQKSFNCILLTLMCCLIAVKAHTSDSAFERIKHSLPQREAGWKIIKADDPYDQRDGSKQAHFLWANGVEEVGATVILYKSLKTAKDQFKRSHKDESSMDVFLVDGIGDEAYLFPPIILNQDGPFNLWFRKARYEILMSANLKNTVKRCAKYIIDSISQTNIQTDAAEPRR